MMPFMHFVTVLDIGISYDCGPPPATMPLAPGWALFLDLDGTLCPYEADPAVVTLLRTQRTLLDTLAQRLEGAVCVLSGRRGEDLNRALGDATVVRCGEHGQGPQAKPTPQAHAELRLVQQRLLELAGRHVEHGVWVEAKGASCALHYRRCPQLAESLIAAVRSLASRLFEVRLLEGKGVLEFVPRGASKGSALRDFMEQAPFRGRIPVAVGDDVTDEDAFIAASALSGFGVAVGARPSQAARYRLSDCFAVNAWLDALATAPSESRDA
jgi:trehalose 6-phosphate phosphatase